MKQFSITGGGDEEKPLDGPPNRLTARIESELQRFVGNHSDVSFRSPSLTPKKDLKSEINSPKPPAVRFKIR